MKKANAVKSLVYVVTAAAVAAGPIGCSSQQVSAVAGMVVGAAAVDIANRNREAAKSARIVRVQETPSRPYTIAELDERLRVEPTQRVERLSDGTTVVTTETGGTIHRHVIQVKNSAPDTRAKVTARGAAGPTVVELEMIPAIPGECKRVDFEIDHKVVHNGRQQTERVVGKYNDCKQNPKSGELMSLADISVGDVAIAYDLASESATILLTALKQIEANLGNESALLQIVSSLGLSRQDVKNMMSFKSPTAEGITAMAKVLQTNDVTVSSIFANMLSTAGEMQIAAQN